MPTPPDNRARLIDAIVGAQEHVLATADGLTREQLTASVVPSGWSIATMLGHLTFDDEVLWIHAVLAGEPAGIALIQDGWAAEVGPDPVARYRDAAEHSREILAAVDLDAAPRWWPSPEVFPFPAFASGWDCAERLLAETTTHAGHLDVARELIDGHQHLVVG